MVFGRFGEANPAVYDLIEACSLAKARKVIARTASLNAMAQGDGPQVANIQFWKDRFLDMYLRVLSTSVGYYKAGVIISRKGLIGLNPDEQKRAAGNFYGTSSLCKIFAGFKQDHFGPSKGTHFYDT